jgi:hypothetical protein
MIKISADRHKVNHYDASALHALIYAHISLSRAFLQKLGKK